MNLNLHIEALNDAKTALDETIDACEKLRKQQHKRGNGPAMENLLKEREAIAQTIIQMQKLARTMGLQDTPPTSRSSQKMSAAVSRKRSCNA